MDDVEKVLRELLARPGMTQARLARDIGVSQGTISKWLSGTQSPNKKQWDAVVAIAEGHKRAAEAKRPAPPTLVQVPLLDLVSAGKLANPTSQIPVEDVPLLAYADLGRGEFFALRVDGDSMDRISPDGSIIVINRRDRQLIAGRYYVFSVRGQTTYKVWHHDPDYLAPFSTNPAHQPIFMRRKRDLEVIGRVRRSVLDL